MYHIHFGSSIANTLPVSCQCSDCCQCSASIKQCLASALTVAFPRATAHTASVEVAELTTLQDSAPLGALGQNTCEWRNASRIKRKVIINISCTDNSARLATSTTTRIMTTKISGLLRMTTPLRTSLTSTIRSASHMRQHQLCQHLLRHRQRLRHMCHSAPHMCHRLLRHMAKA